jgi:hypothetical protein
MSNIINIEAEVGEICSIQGKGEKVSNLDANAGRGMLGRAVDSLTTEHTALYHKRYGLSSLKHINTK